MEPKFNVGDEVRITMNPERPDDDPGFISNMNEYKGKRTRITKVRTNQRIGGHEYEIDIGGPSYRWAERWLESIEEGGREMQQNYDKLIIHCPIKEEYRQIVDLIGWFDGETDYHLWDDKKEQFAVKVEGNKIQSRSSLIWYKRGDSKYQSYTFTTAAEVLQQNQLEPVEEEERMAARFNVGDIIKINKSPSQWSSALSGESPLNLGYPGEFVIEEIEKQSSYVGIKASGYGFNLTRLIVDNNIELIGGADEEKQETKQQENSQGEVAQPAQESRQNPELLMDDEELLTVFQALISQLKEKLAEGQNIVFPPWKFVLPEKKLEAHNFYFESRERDIDSTETIRLLGVTLYHLMTGESELNRESYILDGYITPLDSKLWPAILLLLSATVSDTERVEDMVKEISAAH